jgi:high-affinity Fe2+/Pb2+ permease
MTFVDTLHMMMIFLGGLFIKSLTLLCKWNYYEIWNVQWVINPWNLNKKCNIWSKVWILNFVNLKKNIVEIVDTW